MRRIQAPASPGGRADRTRALELALGIPYGLRLVHPRGLRAWTAETVTAYAGSSTAWWDLDDAGVASRIEIKMGKNGDVVDAEYHMKPTVPGPTGPEHPKLVLTPGGYLAEAYLEVPMSPRRPGRHRARTGAVRHPGRGPSRVGRVVQSEAARRPRLRQIETSRTRRPSPMPPCTAP